MFVDDDGIGYLIFGCGGVTDRDSPHWPNQNYEETLRERDIIYVGEYNADFPGSPGSTEYTRATRSSCAPAGARQHHVQVRGNYYLCASDLRGWNASPTAVMVSDTVTGPYTALDGNSNYHSIPGNPEGPAPDPGTSNYFPSMDGTESNASHTTQVSFSVNVKADNGNERVIHAGDRWANCADNGMGFNQWNPLSFSENPVSGVGAVPFYNNLSQWCLDVENATREVGPNNNYIHNPNFEIDRIAGSIT